MRKLADLYEQWILKERRDVVNLLPNQKNMATNNLKYCDESLRRIRSRIDSLENDSVVRLAFLFMNKVMDTQSQWYRDGQHLIWRPFQIAFILQCIEGIAYRDHADRQICDLLWYPTGGGKTEAYLGLVVFCLAMRLRS
jgi:hypothetical protein